MNKNLIALTLPIVVGLVGCSNANDDLQTWMKNESGNMKGQVTPLPPVTPFTPVGYIGREIGDPFAPKKNSTKVTSSAPDAKRKKDFLESFSLDRLLLVGTIKRQGILWGLVKAPDGTVSMVKNGDYMGQNFGKITTVKDTGLQIKESVLDPQGDWLDRQVDFTITSAK
jgi:type IV pilus assembly protein PilP